MFNDLNVVGISWKQSKSADLQNYLLSEKNLAKQLNNFKAKYSLSGIAYLSTCNRVEVIYSTTKDTKYNDLRPFIYELLTGNIALPGEAIRKLKAWHSEGACEHIFLVTSGLDSAALGEVEITGQVRKCRDYHLKNNFLDKKLELLFEQALKVSANVRKVTGIGKGKTSLSELAIKHIEKHFNTHKEPVAIVGFSDFTTRLAQSLYDLKIPFFFVNRTKNKFFSLSKKYNTEHYSLDDFLSSPSRFSSLLSSTSSSNHIFDKNFLNTICNEKKSVGDKLFIDMSLTSDISPEACNIFGIKRVSLDQINNEAKLNQEVRKREAAIAREIIDKSLEDLSGKYAERIYAPVFSILQDKYLFTANEGLKKLMKKELKGIGHKEKDAIKVWCNALAKRFAHIPSVGLRGLMQKGPEGSLEAFLEGIDDDFSKELKNAMRLVPEKRNEKVR